MRDLEKAIVKNVAVGTSVPGAAPCRGACSGQVQGIGEEGPFSVRAASTFIDLIDSQAV